MPAFWSSPSASNIKFRASSPHCTNWSRPMEPMVWTIAKEPPRATAGRPLPQVNDRYIHRSALPNVQPGDRPPDRDAVGQGGGGVAMPQRVRDELRRQPGPPGGALEVLLVGAAGHVLVPASLE